MGEMKNKFQTDNKSKSFRDDIFRYQEEIERT